MMKLHSATEIHEQARMAMLKALEQFGDRIRPEEIVAVLAYTVGQAIAMLDQRQFSSSDAMTLVSENIKQGNADAIKAALGITRGNA